MTTICAVSPTTHIAFDEMTAVLAGDALLTIAFSFWPEPNLSNAEVRSALVRLAELAGHIGMIGGQVIDMLAPSFIEEFQHRVINCSARRPDSCLNSPARREIPILGEASWTTTNA